MKNGISSFKSLDEAEGWHLELIVRIAAVVFLLPDKRLLDHGADLAVHHPDKLMFLFVFIDFRAEESEGLAYDRLVKLQLILLALYILGHVVYLLGEEVHELVLIELGRGGTGLHSRWLSPWCTGPGGNGLGLGPRRSPSR